ncbi:hypothetical protein RQM59_02960 [Flavobacteriaceae bacterium S356]|uniref:Uncharacterized protein n=1 Tax=Asprobacillus argus TaxID=3076534 RepID=A0ABU3LC71_9FLAO|nr:hypothetical protein [Flavobacteriaceae bacterium S356]
MKQDIRNLFKMNEFPKKKLPTSHEEEFLKKLKKGKNKRLKKRKMLPFLRVAAFVVLLFSVGIYFQKEKGQKTALEIQVEEIEKAYLKDIDREWKAFIKITDDQNLIKKYKEKLQELDDRYTEISEQYSKDSNDISVLESLIENLQRRLQLLKDIKEHIIELNQKNKSNETIYL